MGHHDKTALQKCVKIPLMIMLHSTLPNHWYHQFMLHHHHDFREPSHCIALCWLSISYFKIYIDFLGSSSLTFVFNQLKKKIFEIYLDIRWLTCIVLKQRLINKKNIKMRKNGSVFTAPPNWMHIIIIWRLFKKVLLLYQNWIISPEILDSIIIIAS